MGEILSFKTEEEIREHRKIHGGVIFNKEYNEETKMIEVNILHPIREHAPIITWDTYKRLSDDAKKIINCVKYNDEKPVVSLKIGNSFITDQGEEIQINGQLYNELFNFVSARNNGIGFCRRERDDGEIMEIWLPLEQAIRLM